MRDGSGAACITSADSSGETRFAVLQGGPPDSQPSTSRLSASSLSCAAKEASTSSQWSIAKGRRFCSLTAGPRAPPPPFARLSADRAPCGIGRLHSQSEDLLTWENPQMQLATRSIPRNQIPSR